jgi:hypothetical protein
VPFEFPIPPAPPQRHRERVGGETRRQSVLHRPANCRSKLFGWIRYACVESVVARRSRFVRIPGPGQVTAVG